MPKSPSAKQDPAESLPLKPVDFLILLALATGDRHGYAIARDIEERSTIIVEAGNLYRSIRRLLDEGFLIESDRRPAPELDDERRRYYAMSPFGRQVLAAESRRLRMLVRLAESRRVIRPEAG